MGYLEGTKNEPKDVVMREMHGRRSWSGMRIDVKQGCQWTSPYILIALSGGARSCAPMRWGDPHSAEEGDVNIASSNL